MASKAEKPSVDIPSGDSSFDMRLFSTPKSNRPGILDTLSKDGYNFAATLKNVAHDTMSMLSYDDEVVNDEVKGGKLGTIPGVLLPCLQNILGVILFLRLPFITAQAGCIGASLIILICVTSTFLTSLSLSAIATNGQIKAGGPYYVISRNLGVEVGGALGLLFYLGTTIAASMYVLGAIEALQSGFGLSGIFEFDTQCFALLLMFGIAVIVSVGVKYVNMSASLFLCVVFISILCLTLGVVLFAMDVGFNGKLNDSDRVFGDNFNASYSFDSDTNSIPSFASMLALFYPSVTGIMAGSNRSSVLANPGKSIPKGTIGAITITTLIYLSVVWLFGCFISNQALKTDKLIVTAVTFPHELVVKIGIIMSSVGAALQCLTGAPRLLAAIAADETIPFLKLFIPSSPSAEPTRAIWLTWLIASIPTLAGNLDFITPIITMFFLLMYAGCNVSCFFLSVVKSPNFRPTFRCYHWFISLLACIWCLALAFFISWYTASIAIFLCILLCFYIKSQGIVADWGDVRQGFLYNCASLSLNALEACHKIHAKNWRPQVMCVVGMDSSCNVKNSHLLEFVSQLKKGNGLNIILALIDESLFDASFHEKKYLASKTLKAAMNEIGLNAYMHILPSGSNPRETLLGSISTAGLGKMVSNTVLLSYPSLDTREDTFSSLITITAMKKAILLLKGNAADSILVKQTTIDIWWIVFDGGLLLLIPFLLSNCVVWNGKVTLRLFAVITNTVGNKDDLEKAIKEHLQSIRIKAEIFIIDMTSVVHNISGVLRNCDNSVSPRQNSIKFNEKKIDLLRSPKKAEVIPKIKDQTLEEVFADDACSAPDILMHHKKQEHEEMRNNAKRFNTELRRYSSKARLVVLNLPLMKAFRKHDDYFDYADHLSEGIKNVLFIRGSGDEVISTFG